MWGYDEIYIATVPLDEPCAQVGQENYDTAARLEIEAYKGQLVRIFGTPPGSARLVRKTESHDFGAYYSLVIRYADNDHAAMQWAFNVERNEPEHWDEQATVWLRAQGYFELVRAHADAE